MALYPLYGGVLHIIDVVLGLLVGLLVVIVHLCILYRKEIFSFESSLYLVLSYVLNTLCKEVPRLEEDLCSSLFYIVKAWITFFLSISPIFMLFMGLGCITSVV